MTFKVKDALVCDEARREDNGKHFLIGVYSGDIVVPAPTTLKLCVWMVGEKSKTEDVSVQVKVETLDVAGSMRSSNTFTFNIVQDGNEYTVLQIQSLVSIESAGAVVVAVNDGDSNWKEVIHKAIVFDNVPQLVH